MKRAVAAAAVSGRFPLMAVTRWGVFYQPGARDTDHHLGAKSEPNAAAGNSPRTRPIEGNVLAGLSGRIPLDAHSIEAIAGCAPPGRDFAARFGARRVHRLDAFVPRRGRAGERLRRSADLARNLSPPTRRIARYLELDLRDLHPEHQGRRHEARTMLAEIYGWFTEGSDTADLKDARALLDELSD